jgi:hypothetical protein
MTTPATTACDYPLSGTQQRRTGTALLQRTTLADIRNGLPGMRTLATDAANSLPVPEEGEAAIALLDELGDLLGTILDELSSEELGKLPLQVWTLLERIFDIHDDRTSGIG